MAITREQICSLTSRKLAEKAHSLKSVKATVGLDGFVDEIIAVVDKRHDGGKFDPVKTIGHLGAKITAAAGESSNYELVVKQRKLGGNGRLAAAADGEIPHADDRRRQPAPDAGPPLVIAASRADELTVKTLKQRQCTRRNGRTMAMEPSRSGRS